MYLKLQDPGLHLRILAPLKYNLRGASSVCKHTAMKGVWGYSLPGNFGFLDFLRLHLVGFGQNIQHGQYTDILEVSSWFLIYIADVGALAQICYY